MLPSLGLLTTATHTVCRVTTLATPLSILAVEGNTYCNPTLTVNLWAQDAFSRQHFSPVNYS